MTVESTQGTLSATHKLGPFHLMPGITRINGASYFMTAMLAVPMMAAFSFLQPIILRLVGVERAVQGTVSGDLVFYQEIIVLLFTPFVAAIADKVGRRPLVMLGVVWVNALLMILIYSLMTGVASRLRRSIAAEIQGGTRY